ncbi:MAG: glycosyltransferase family A protein [Candidatus Pacebacteria bacterium]|nr:glycosyltransferase family A protein [Candidatus Paceibacterota bacterium]
MQAENTNPRISLIICAHNEEKHIGECLRSVIKNSGGKLHEIIVVDNASTDRTKEIAESFPGVRVSHEKNKGLIRARAHGHTKAKGEILAFIDADTKMPPGWVDTVIDEFKKDKNLACLSGPYIYFDIPKWKQALVAVYWHGLAFPIYLLVGFMAVGGNFAIRKDVLDKMGGFDTSIEFYGEDTNIARRASKFGKVKFKLSMPMHTSGRRLTHHGIFKTSALYISNFLSEVIWHKPITKKYKDVR